MHNITLPNAAGGTTLAVDFNAFPESIREALMIHGLQQKVADSVANAKANAWTQVECLERCNGVVESLKAGTWAKRGGGGPKMRGEEAFIASRIAARIKAKAKAAKVSEPTEEALESLVAKALASVKPEVAAWINTLRAEYAAKNAGKNIDLDLD